MIKGIRFADDAESAARDADALVIVTEWDEFRALDLAAIAGAMRGKALVDLRNVYEKDEANSRRPDLFRRRARPSAIGLNHGPGQGPPARRPSGPDVAGGSSLPAR